MREIRTSGSEGGAGRKPRSYLYQENPRNGWKRWCARRPKSRSRFFSSMRSTCCWEPGRGAACLSDLQSPKFQYLHRHEPDHHGYRARCGRHLAFAFTQGVAAPVHPCKGGTGAGRHHIEAGSSGFLGEFERLWLLAWKDFVVSGFR